MSRIAKRQDRQDEQIYTKSHGIRQGATGIVFSQERDRVLLIQRRDVPVWALPGGGVDGGETPEEAVVREIQEETGLTTEMVRQVALYTAVNRLACDTFVFECRPIAGTLALSNETLDVAFHPLDNLPKTLFFIHKEWIEQALKEAETVHFPLSQVTYWNLIKYFCRHPIQTFRMVLARCGIPYNS